jgi:hypothetical protein
MYVTFVIPALLRVWLDGVDVDAACAPVIAAHRWDYSQRLWYLLSFVSGRIDEAEFRRQPYQHGMPELLLLARALRADCHGDRAAAVGSYEDFLVLPWWQHFVWGVVSEMTRWRIADARAALGLPSTDASAVPGRIPVPNPR